MSEFVATSSPMQRALELARGALGTTSPNPAVGAVLVQEGRIVGEGATQPPGGAHAEIMAIRSAAAEAAGATLYVTLEPCSTQGRTPPCSDAIAAAGIKTVIVATGDPDARANGSGLVRLRDAGIAVTTGDGAAEALLHYEAYAHHRRSGRPYVIAKFAGSLDGKIAATSGDSRWVSGPETRAWAHRVRPTIDAILVGVETILIDDPELTARPDGIKHGVPQPLRVVLDSRGRTPPTARVLREQDLAPTLIVTTAAASAEWRSEIEASGARIAEVPADAGRVALTPLLELLASQHGIVSLLVEGGGRVHGSFFDAGLVNKVYAVIAPMVIGGDAASAVAGSGAEHMRDAVRLRDISVERLGDDLLVTGYPIGAKPTATPIVRPAGPEDIDAHAALVQDPAQRQTIAAAARRAIDRAAEEEGAGWVAIEDACVVGGITLVFNDASRAERADGRETATLEGLLVAPAWRYHGLAERLVETAEASAAGRGYRWMTVRIAEGRGMDGGGRDEWKRRGYRYYRRDDNGGVLLIREIRAANERDDRRA